MAKHRRFDFASVARPAAIRDSAVRILQRDTPPDVLDLDRAKSIPVDIIDPDPDQFRKHFDEESLRELAQNILSQGVLQPIIVEWVAETNRFRVIAGERRRRAIKLAAQLQAEDPAASSRDLTRIPAIVRDANLVERSIQQVSENESRQDYSDVERAFAYERLKELLDVTWEELGTKLGLSRQRIHQIRSTKNRLAPSVQDDIAQRKITERQARRLVLLPPPVQEGVAAAIKEHHLTQHQTDALVQRVRSAIQAPPPPATVVGPTEKLTEESASAASEPAPDPTIPPDERQPWLTEIVAQAVDAVTRPEPSATPESAPAEEQQSAVVDRGPVDRALEWIAQRDQFDGITPEDPAERRRLANGLDALIVWATALRDRLREGM